MKSYITVILAFFSLIINAQTSFQDNLTGEEQGEFPSRWDLIQGSAEIASLNGGPIIYLANKSIITPLINSKNYLSNNFTLEFDAFYDGARKINFHQYYEVRFWDGHSYLVLKDGKGFLNQLSIYCNGGRIDGRVNGAKVKYDGYRESLKENKKSVWRHIKVNFNNGAIKVFIDDILLVNIPKIELNPSMISIGVFTHEYADFVRAIKNVSLTGINNNNTADNNSTDPNTPDGTTDNAIPNEQTEDYKYNLPIQDGAPNQILQTDGNGTVNWVNDNHPENNTTGVDTTNSNTVASVEDLKINDLLDGKSDTDGSSVFLGLRAGALDDGTDNNNVGVGSRVLILNTTGSFNAANGYQALKSNATGNHNTANGNKALNSNDTGNSNTANGSLSLSNNTFGEKNTANGQGALYNNTIGNNNTVSGTSALASNITGSSNTVFGTLAGQKNVSGNGNVFIGNRSGFYELSNNKLYIENSNADANNALIYGDFYTDILRTNGELQIGNPTNGGYAFPKVAGTANQILQIDGNGNVAWVDNMATGVNTSTSETTSSGSGVQKINDLTDGKSDVNGSSIYLGLNAGATDVGANNNIGIGFEALKNNSTGNGNTAIGYNTLVLNSAGVNNTANGSYALRYNTTGSQNTAIGYYALYQNATGSFNTANGASTLTNNTTGEFNTAIGNTSLFYNTAGDKNTAVGNNTLFQNRTGKENTAIGYNALYKNIVGTNNTANGSQALYSNGSGNYNTANGYQALYSNVDGKENTANGYRSLYSNSVGIYNTANGSDALYYNTKGNSNTANGYRALYKNTLGNENTANGHLSLANNTTGKNNTANGSDALFHNNSGTNNTATGYGALYSNTSSNGNVANGFDALYNNTTGRRNTASGANALKGNTTGSNNTAIGYDAQVPDGTASNQVRVGNTHVTYAGIQVAWMVTSDKLWKEKIRELPYGLEVVKQLKPVDYIRKNNESKTREMGFIAQDVEAVLTKIGYKDQGFLTKDDKGQMSLRYNDFIALLAKAIQEQQKIIENQDKEIQSLTSELGDNKKEQDSKFESLYKRLEQLEQANNQ